MRLIDADALKEAVSNNPLIDFTDDDIFELIDNAPTVEVTKPQSYVMGFCDGLKAQTYEKPPMFERPQGEWIEDSGNIACSHCHIIWLYRKTDFCPNCGADMRGSK